MCTGAGGSTAAPVTFARAFVAFERGLRSLSTSANVRVSPAGAHSGSQKPGPVPSFLAWLAETGAVRAVPSFLKPGPVRPVSCFRSHASDR